MQLQMDQSDSSSSIASFNVSISQKAENFMDAIYNNNLTSAQALNCPHLINSYFEENMNPLHIVISRGYERMMLWMLQEGGDLAIKTKDGYDCLSLAVRKGNLNMTQMILSRVEPNHVGPEGTALHIACKLDSPELVKTLLAHPNIDFTIKFQGQTPSETAGKITRQLLEKEKTRSQTTNATQLEGFRESITNYIRLTQISQNSLVVNRPQIPPVVKGQVMKVNYFKFIQYERYLIMDPTTGVLARFREQNDFPLNPCELIPLELIQKTELSSGLWFQRKRFSYLKITYGDKDIYFAVRHLEVARKWKEMINKGIGYFKYMRNKMNEYKKSNQQDKIQQAMIHDMMQLLDENLTLLDETYLDQTYYIIEKQQQVKNAYRAGLETVPEQSKYEDEIIKSAIGIKDLEIIECIGQGSFGYVYKVKYGNNVYALKQQEKAQLINTGNMKYTLCEVQVLSRTYHPFLINCIQAFQTPQNLYLLLEYCPNGDLSQYMTRGVIWVESQAKYYIAQVILAIEYLHLQDIVYRDIKPENIALDADFNIKLIDFGLAKEGIEVGMATLSICGSPAYLAPEILQQQGATRATDIYGIGLVLYEMLSGYPPYYSHDVNEMFRSIIDCPLKLPQGASVEAKDLLQKILHKKASKRPSMAQVKEHQFFLDIDWKKVEAKQYKTHSLKRYFNSPARGRKRELVDYDYEEDGSKDIFVQKWNFSR